MGDLWLLLQIGPHLIQTTLHLPLNQLHLLHQSDSPGAKPSPSNCHEYYTCNIGSNGWVIRPQTCGDLAFNPATENCDWPYYVPGCDEGTTMGKIGFTFILVSLVVSLMLHLYPLLFSCCYICVPCCVLYVIFVSLVVFLMLYLYPLLYPWLFVSVVVSLMCYLYPLLFSWCYICIPCCFLDAIFVSLVVSLMLYLYPLLFSWCYICIPCCILDYLNPLLYPWCVICIPCCILDVLFVSLVVSLICYLYPLLYPWCSICFPCCILDVFLYPLLYPWCVICIPCCILDFIFVSLVVFYMYINARNLVCKIFEWMISPNFSYWLNFNCIPPSPLSILHPQVTLPQIKPWSRMGGGYNSPPLNFYKTCVTPPLLTYIWRKRPNRDRSKLP